MSSWLRALFAARAGLGALDENGWDALAKAGRCRLTLSNPP